MTIEQRPSREREGARKGREREILYPNLRRYTQQERNTLMAMILIIYCLMRWGEVCMGLDGIWQPTSWRSGDANTHTHNSAVPAATFMFSFILLCTNVTGFLLHLVTGCPFLYWELPACLFSALLYRLPCLYLLHLSFIPSLCSSLYPSPPTSSSPPPHLCSVGIVSPPLPLCLGIL